MLVKRELLIQYFSTVAIIILFGGFQYVFSLFAAGSDRSSGNLAFQIISFVCYSFSLVYLTLHRAKDSYLVIWRSFPLVFLILFCIFSALWSEEPSTSLRRASALFLSTVFCLFLAVSLSYSKFISIMWGSCVIYCVFGALASLLPGVGTDPMNWQYPDAWRGLTGNKTDFGRISAIGILLSYYVIKEKTFLKRYVLFFLALFFLCLIKSEAVTPLVLVILVITMTPGIFLLAKNDIQINVTGYVIRWSFILLICVLVYIIANYIFEPLVESIGKDATLTGRTFIWEYGFLQAQDNPWLGTGFRSFWIDKITFDFYYYNPFWGEELMNNGHNGFIDVYLELGLVGFLIYSLFILDFINSFLKKSNSVSSNDKSFGLMLVIFYFLYSITEQVTLEQSDFFWMLLTTVYFKMKLKNNA